MTQQDVIDDINRRMIKIYDPLIIYFINLDKWKVNEDPVFNSITLRIIVQSSLINDPNGIPNSAPVTRAEVGYEALDGLPWNIHLLVFTKDEFKLLEQAQEIKFLVTQKYGTKIYELK